MQRQPYHIITGIIILLLFSHCAEDDGMVHFGTFHSSKYFRVTVKHLAQSSSIQGYPCKRGKVRFHFNDSLLSFRAAEEIRLDGGIIPAESRIYLYNNGRPENIYLSANAVIQGYEISSKKRMQGAHLGFYADGTLRKFWPANNVEIENIPCSHMHEIELYPDGSLLHGHLAGEFQEGTHRFPVGSHILRDMGGNLHPYSFPIQVAITRLMNIEEHFSEPLLYAYHKRMEGKVDSVHNIFRSNRNDRNPMIHYELARIKRHRMIGGADVSIYSYLNSARRSWVDPYNVITAFLDAESMLFVERNKGKLRKEDRFDNFYWSAMDGFESVIEMKPDYHAARLHLVDLYSHLPADQGGDRGKAEMHAGELLKYDTIWAARAQAILLPEGKSRLDFWLGFERGHSENPMFQQELGRAYMADGNLIHAEACFRKSIALDSARCSLLIDLAHHHLKQVRRDKTRAELHSALAESCLLEYIDTDPVNPHKAWCYAKIAWLKDLAGETEEGAKLLTRAKQLDMRFSREEKPPSLLLFIPLGEVFTEFESHFRHQTD